MTKLNKGLLRLLLLLAMMVATNGAMAQYSYRFSDELGTYRVKFTPHKETKFKAPTTKPLLPATHELRIGILWGGLDCHGNIANDNSLYYYSDRVDVSKLSGPDHWYAFTLDYGYWAREWFSIGGSISWIAGLRNYYNEYDHKHAFTDHINHISIMPIARFAWLRKGRVQLYSSIGFGFGILHQRFLSNPRVNSVNAYFTYDLKPFGIAVGRKWFGYMELGYGSRGVINVGFGYRINTKTK